MEYGSHIMSKIVLERMNLVQSLVYENILKHAETVFPQNINELHGIAAGSKVSFCRKIFLSFGKFKSFVVLGQDSSL